MLGLITLNRVELENRDEIIARIKEAAQYVDINQLCFKPTVWFWLQRKRGISWTEEQQPKRRTKTKVGTNPGQSMVDA